MSRPPSLVAIALACCGNPGSPVAATVVALASASAAPVPDAAAPVSLDGPDAGSDRDASSTPDASEPWLDTAAWASAHHVTAPPSDIGRCREVQVGPSSSEGLLCLLGPPTRSVFPSGESLYTLDVFVADHGASKRVLRAPMAAGPLDQMGAEPWYSVTLEVALVSPTRIVVSDGATPSCSAAEADAKTKHDTRGGAVVGQACASRGTFVWRGDRFVKQ